MFRVGVMCASLFVLSLLIVLPVSAREVEERAEASETPDQYNERSGDDLWSDLEKEDPEMSRDDLDEEDLEEESEIEVPENIEDEASDLSDDDHQIRGIDIASGSADIRVRYQQRARLFGFIPVPYSFVARVNLADDTVEVSRPWWLFLASDGVDDIEAGLQAQKDTLTSSDTASVVLKKLSALLKALSQ